MPRRNVTYGGQAVTLERALADISYLPVRYRLEYESLLRHHEQLLKRDPVAADELAWVLLRLNAALDAGHLPGTKEFNERLSMPLPRTLWHRERKKLGLD